MPRLQNVTQDAVFAACDELMASNTRPTLENIRLKTGGSYSTLSPMLKAWRNQHREQSTVVLDMPEAVLSGFRSAAAELWKAATSEAITRAKAIEEEAERKVSEARAEVEELMSVVRALEQDLATAQSFNQEAKLKLSRSDHSIAELSEKLTRERGQLDALKGILEQQTQRNIELERELIGLVKAQREKQESP